MTMRFRRERALLSTSVLACSVLSVIGIDPTFDVPIVNVTVVKGQTAVLPCSIDHLNKFKVAWLDHHSIPLTYEERRVVDDSRFSVVRPYVKEWNLQVRDIHPLDEGEYRCTINTNPVKSKVVILHVKVPADIVEEWSSSDVTVQEGDSVWLHCNVTGVPPPTVTWHRRTTSGRDVHDCRQRTVDAGFGVLGAVMVISNISRHCAGVYECEASNGVPPPVNRRMEITVEFAPQIVMPNRRIGQQTGRETILECAITAFPHALNYWEKDGRRITSSMKHRIEAYDEGDHMVTLSLRIHITDAGDFGEYRCIASNSLGHDEGSTVLYETFDTDIRPVAPVHQPSAVRTDNNSPHLHPHPTTSAGHSQHQPADYDYHVGATHEQRRDHQRVSFPSSGRMTEAGNGYSRTDGVTPLFVTSSIAAATSYFCGCCLR